jgi:hypothetical protein
MASEVREGGTISPLKKFIFGYRKWHVSCMQDSVCYNISDDVIYLIANGIL